MNIPSSIYDVNFPSDNLSLSNFPKSIRDKGDSILNLITDIMRSSSSTDFGPAEANYTDVPFLFIKGSTSITDGLYFRINPGVWSHGYNSDLPINVDETQVGKRVWSKGLPYTLKRILNTNLTSSYVWSAELDINPLVRFELETFSGATQGNISSVCGLNSLNIKNANKISFLPQALNLYSENSYLETVNAFTPMEFTGTITVLEADKPTSGYSYLYEINVGADKFALISNSAGNINFVHNSNTYATGLTVPTKSFQLSFVYSNGKLVSYLDEQKYEFVDSNNILRGNKLFSFFGVSMSNPTYKGMVSVVTEPLFFDKVLTCEELKFLKRNPRCYDFALQNNSFMDFSEYDFYKLKTLITEDFMDVVNSLYEWYEGAEGPTNLYLKTVEDNDRLREELLGITDKTNEFYKLKNGNISIKETLLTHSSVTGKKIVSSCFTENTTYCSFENGAVLGFNSVGSVSFNDNSTNTMDDLIMFQGTLFARRRSVNSTHNIVSYNTTTNSWQEYSFGGYSNITVNGPCFFFELQNNLCLYMNTKTYKMTVDSDGNKSFIDVTSKFPSSYKPIDNLTIVSSNGNIFLFDKDLESSVVNSLNNYSDSKVVSYQRYFIYKDANNKVVYFNGRSHVEHKSVPSEYELVCAFENSYIFKKGNSIIYSGIDEKEIEISSNFSKSAVQLDSLKSFKIVDLNNKLFDVKFDASGSIASTRYNAQVEADFYEHPEGEGFKHVPAITSSNINKYLKSKIGGAEFSSIQFSELTSVPQASTSTSGIVKLTNGSQSETEAPTAKSLYDVKVIADGALQTKGGVVNGDLEVTGSFIINGIKITIEV